MSRPMQPSWLVQRLNKPYGGPFGPDNPFSFGGGLRNGGLTDEAMGLLRGIFSFDYMGAAEFEFGAVPEALQGLAKDAADLDAFTISVPLAQVPADFRDKSKAIPEGAAEIYVICRHKQANEVTKRIEGWTKEAWPSLKEGLRLTAALRPFNEWDERTVGWLELDNGFFFFTDRDMWRQTCDLFGVTTAAGAR